ncbi:MAG: J domain-containing protein [Xanthobacteraceae bacterium]
MTVEAYPLQWPDGWPRTAFNLRESDRKFGGHVHGLTMGRARDQLLDELRLLGARDIVVSTNVQLRRDGLPYSDQRRIEDPGVAVYFTLKKRPRVMARDRFISVAGNMRSLTLAVEAMRQLERHGGSHMVERAFAGFTAIAPPDWKKPWREVFGVKPEWRGDIAALYREKARHRHPDVGGADTLMAELNDAYAEAKRELGA